MTLTRLALLDRDGTLIEHIPYLDDPGKVRLLPGVVAGLKGLQELGFALVMVSNQSGLGRGFFSETRLRAIHDIMEDQLRQEGVVLDRLYYCPHQPGLGCLCRKPSIGLAETASRELGLPIHGGIVVGDSICDMELAKNLGWRGFLLPDSSAQAPKDVVSWQAAQDYQPGFRRVCSLVEVPSLLQELIV